MAVSALQTPAQRDPLLPRSALSICLRNDETAHLASPTFFIIAEIILQEFNAWLPLPPVTEEIAREIARACRTTSGMSPSEKHFECHAFEIQLSRRRITFLLSLQIEHWPGSCSKSLVVASAPVI
jgi:hypothetical protein